jgi:hypothetical protein
MPRAVLCSSLLALLLCAFPARADGGAYRLFVAGASPGEPSTGKQVTTYSLYGASALGLVAGGYFLVDWSRVDGERSDFLNREPNACADAGSDSCARSMQLIEDGNRSLNLGLGGLAVGVTLALSGVVVAEYWPNLVIEPGLALSPDAGYAAATLRF